MYKHTAAAYIRTWSTTHIQTDESTHCNYFTPDIHLQSESNHSHTRTLTFSDNKPDWQQLYRHPQLVINKVLTAKRQPLPSDCLGIQIPATFNPYNHHCKHSYARNNRQASTRHKRVARLFLSVHHPPVTTRLSPTHCFNHDKPLKTCDTHFNCTFTHHSLSSQHGSQHDSRHDAICQYGWRQPCTLTSLSYISKFITHTGCIFYRYSIVRSASHSFLKISTINRQTFSLKGSRLTYS